MAEKRKGARRRSNEQSQQLTKEEDKIARFVRFNCPTKSTMFEGNEVHYFTGIKAVDVLYDSKKYGHMAENGKFATRNAAVAFMRTLIEKGLLFRARKLVPKKKDDKKERTALDSNKSPKKRLEKTQIGKGDEKKNEGDSDANGESEEKDKKIKEKEDEEKKKRKVKLELHQDQSFNDFNDVYVWVFDPTPLYKQVIGALMVLGTIAGCLFPLWPMWLRQGVYYLSIAGLTCFGVLIGVAAARSILFAAIWLGTMGKHKLWLLPNLTEDCGFFESFQPWYTYEYCPGSVVIAESKKKKKSETKKDAGEIDDVTVKEKGDSSNLERGKGEQKEVEEESDSKHNIEYSEHVENANLDDDNEGEEEDGKSGSGTDFDESSQETTGGSTTGEHSKIDESEIPGSSKVKLRRRFRKVDDDFVLIEK